MTTTQNTQPAPEAPVIEPEPKLVKARKGSKLEQLHALYAEVKAEADAAAKKLKTITDAIKLELTGLDPNERRFELASGADAPPLRLNYVESWRIDTPKMKREDPETYVRFAKKSGSWRLSTGGE